MVNEVEEKVEEGAGRIIHISCEEIYPDVDHTAHECRAVELEMDISPSLTDDTLVQVIIKATDNFGYANGENTNENETQ